MWSRTSSGTVKGSVQGQPSASLVRAISSSPSGDPWLDEVPAFDGEPWPMTVRTAMRLGRSSCSAAAIAARSDATSVTSSTRSVCHP